MATLNNYHHVFTTTQKQTKPIKFTKPLLLSSSKLFHKSRNSCKKQYPLVKSVAEDKEFVTEKISVVVEHEREEENGSEDEEEEVVVKNEFVGKAINACIVLGFGTLGVTRLLTIDHEFWHGWTLYEILRYAPEHNWIAYEEALKENPVFAKMVISGIVYSLGDWIAQCYEGKPLFEFDRTRLFRSGLVGFALHGSLSHYYYQICEALIPSKDWWVVPAKIAFDQTAWSAVWNSIYFVVLGLLRFESPENIFNELKTTFLPLLMAGWKLWPFAHLITYGVIPVEQRLLWVDCVELIWVTILSTYSNEKAETRISDTTSDVDPTQ
ncbi:peroxisomal membrane 22 kDa (Mpv17/PMP22) family protein [Artemisia annua]|uniref:Peroxisomal membrane 22 kDa (Mpv17/PMP22) family protein n=1 Tax=Artemisia annua TaxID=35608 RepID=A0A2U1PNL3_ARTAN|nr:peroxisomal membrane 22 kDa (Mpv17/PMP22) family protein [Artemisia annua]